MNHHWILTFLTIPLLAATCVGNELKASAIPTNLDTLLIDSTCISDESISFDLNPYLQMLYDTVGDINFEDIQRQEKVFGEVDPVLLDNTQTVVKRFWLHLSICSDTQSNSKWYLGLRHPVVGYHVSKNGGPWLEGEFGTHVHHSGDAERILSDIFFPIQLGPNMCHEYYFLVTPAVASYRTHGIMGDYQRLLMNRSHIDTLHRKSQAKNLPLFGILLAIGLYQLVIFFFNKDTRFLYIALVNFAWMIMISSNSGLLMTFLDIKTIGSYLNFGTPLAYLIYSVNNLFVIKYLRIPKHHWEYKLLMFGFVIWIIIHLLKISLGFLPLDSFLSFQNLIAQGDFILIQFGNIMYITIAVSQILRGNKFAPYFLFSYGVWIVGLAITIFSNFGFIPNYDFGLYNLCDFGILGAALSMLLFSFGLAYQFRTLEIQRLEAEKKQAIANQLHQAKDREAERLKELDHFKSQLYTNITHEFRTPLTVISGLADHLKGNPEEKIMIQRNASNLLGLVNQMLDLSKIDTGHLQPEWVQTDIIPLVKYLTETYRNITKQQNKDFKLQVFEDTLWLDTDLEMFESILNNLVFNAIKYTPEEGQIQLKISADPGKKVCILQVQDSGRGIPPEHLNKIFERFYQVDNSNTRYSEGTGIGLALVYELIQLLNGTITVESQVHEGSTFTVTLPLSKKAPVKQWKPNNMSQPEKISARQDILEVSGSPNNKDVPVVLCVEDHRDVMHYLQKLLEKEYKVLKADNGRLGLTMASTHIPDLIISDIMMPEMDGYTLSEKLKSEKSTSHIPLILLTAKSSQEDRLTGLEGGADAYLTKPFDKRELLIRIEKLLDGRERLRAHYQQFQMLPREKVSENRFLRDVRDQIESNFSNEDYGIKDLAKALHFSRTQIYRKLKALTGKTFSNLIQEMKIQQAKDLLLKTDSNISVISYKLGFRDPSHFSKVFKKWTNTSPKEYRKIASE